MADTEYLPGRVYRATVRGVPNVLVYKHYANDDNEYWYWKTLKRIGGTFVHTPREVTNIVGPLYTLHLNNPRRIIEVLENATYYSAGSQIREQLPPTRIPEPPKGSFVEASVRDSTEERMVFARHPQTGSWYRLGGVGRFMCGWDILVDPKLVNP